MVDWTRGKRQLIGQVNAWVWPVRIAFG